MYRTYVVVRQVRDISEICKSCEKEVEARIHLSDLICFVSQQFKKVILQLSYTRPHNNIAQPCRFLKEWMVLITPPASLLLTAS